MDQQLNLLLLQERDLGPVQCPNRSSHSPVAPVPGDLMSPSDFHQFLHTHGEDTVMSSHIQMHTYKINIILKCTVTIELQRSGYRRRLLFLMALPAV